MKSIAKLHYITHALDGQSHAKAAEAACAAGVDWVQLRVKKQSEEVWLQEAQHTKAICRKYASTFIINDNVALAAAMDADGVHLGMTDMAPEEARRLLGPEKIIGGTANTFQDIQRLAGVGVNYIGLGPFRFSATKENLSPILGLNGYKAILKQCRAAGIRLPIIAIGGIVSSTVKEILETGVYGVAVSSGINMASEKTLAVKHYMQYLLANDPNDVS